VTGVASCTNILVTVYQLTQYHIPDVMIRDQFTQHRIPDMLVTFD